MSVISFQICLAREAKKADCNVKNDVGLNKTGGNRVFA